VQFFAGKLSEEFVCEGDDFGAFIPSAHDFVVMDEVVLIGGDEETATEFDIGPTFTFGDPFGVLLKEGVEFFSSWDFAPFQEALADEKDVFDEKVLPVDELDKLAELTWCERGLSQMCEGEAEFFFELVKLVQVGGGGLDNSLCFVGSTAFAGSGSRLAWVF